ncbi:MAG: hypothetical protein HY892_04525 [Deltaproteobacteria bacterium]|nr:hypothetical protein [Deltaproteobacteria bacterium]
MALASRFARSSPSQEHSQRSEAGKLLELEKRHGPRYRPAGLIREMGEDGKTSYPV